MKGLQMLKRFLLGTATCLVLATGAIAQIPAQPAQPSQPSNPSQPSSPSTPRATESSPDDCLKSAFDLAQRAEAKKMSSEELDKLEELLSQLEGHCDAKRFPEAQAMAGEISTMIEQKPAGDLPTAPTSKE